MQKAIEMHLGAKREDGDEIPEPSIVETLDCVTPGEPGR